MMKFLFGMYKLIIWPLFPAKCRYSPTCSVYTYQQIQKHGTIAGLMLGAKRIASCHG